MPGSGKSAVVQVLRACGVDAHDADGNDFRKWRDIETGEIVEHAPDPTAEWQPKHQLVLVPERVEALRPSDPEHLVVLAGHVPNEAECLHLFDGVIAIAVDDETLRARLRDRPGRSFGKTPEVRDAIVSWNRASAAHFERIGAQVVDGTMPLADVAEGVLQALRAPHPR